MPTVWTNVLAGTLLAGGAWQSWRTGLFVLAMTLFYVGGMYLNDFLLGAAIAVMASLGIASAASALVLAAAIVAYDTSFAGWLRPQ